jgi:diguanylate cyclase (GGDEF)-like protein
MPSGHRAGRPDCRVRSRSVFQTVLVVVHGGQGHRRSSAPDEEARRHVVVLDRGVGDGQRLVEHLAASRVVDAAAVGPADLSARVVPWPGLRIDDVAAVLLMVQAHPGTVAATERIVELLGEVPLVVVADDDDALHGGLLAAGVSEVVPLPELSGRALERAVRAASARRRSRAPGAPHASVDALTGLVNRTGLGVDLPLRLARADRPGAVVVVYADLDRFKLVNDTYGHSVGDDVLVEAADRLRRSVRSSDLVVRVGGDEFVIVLDGPRVERVAEEVSRRILRAFGSGIPVGGHHLSVGISMGLATSLPGESAGDLVTRADRALYLAKQRGRGRIARYDDDLERSIEQLQRAASALGGALEHGGLRVVARPVMDRSSATVLGHHCVPVWSNELDLLLPAPGAGCVASDAAGRAASPGEVSCQVGRAADLVRWVASQVGRSLDPTRVLAAPRRVYLDVPGPVLAHAPVRGLEAIRPERRERIVLLVDEDWLVQHPDVPGVGELIDAGFSLGLARFGASHGSLHLLARYPFESVWVDDRVIHGLADDATRRAELAGIVATAAPLGQRVVAHEPRRSFDADALDRVGGVAIVRSRLSATPTRPVDGDATQPLATVLAAGGGV